MVDMDDGALLITHSWQGYTREPTTDRHHLGMATRATHNVDVCGTGAESGGTNDNTRDTDKFTNERGLK